MEDINIIAPYNDSGYPEDKWVEMYNSLYKSTQAVNTLSSFKGFLSQYRGADEVEEAERLSLLQFMNAFGAFAYDRCNLVGHLSSSSWIVNKDHTKVLFIFHNIFKTWAWVGGHTDKDLDLQYVAVKEMQEETGLKNYRLLTPIPFDLSVLVVHNHYKHGTFVPRHLHYNVVYAFEADEKEFIRMKPDENSGIQWININEIDKFCATERMLPYYQRIVAKIKKIG